MGSVVGPNGWWSMFIMCVWGSWHDGALGHWHGNSLAITPAALRSNWCSYMGHRRLQHSHRYEWKLGFCSFSSPHFFFPPLWVSWRNGRKALQHVSVPRANVLPLCSALSLFFLSLSFFFFALWSVSKLPFSLSVSTTFTLFLLIFSPPPRKVNALQESPPHTFKKKKKADCFAQTQFKPDCPQCCLLLKLLALWIPSVWRECPLHFFNTVTWLHSHTLLHLRTYTNTQAY